MNSDFVFYRSLFLKRIPMMATIFVLCSAMGVGLAVIIPWSLWSIARIRREDWPDITVPVETDPAEEA